MRSALITAVILMPLSLTSALGQQCPLNEISEQNILSINKSIPVLHNKERSELFFVSHMNWNNDGGPFTYHPDEWKGVKACRGNSNASAGPKSANTLCNGISIKKEDGSLLLGYMTQAEAKKKHLDEKSRRAESIKRCTELLCYAGRAQKAEWITDSFNINWPAIATKSVQKSGRTYNVPCIQNEGPFKGYFVSTTSYKDDSITDVCDVRRYVDPFSVPAVVRPGSAIFSPIKASGASDKPQRLEGGVAVVVDFRTSTPKVHYAIIGDSGPKNEAGEVTPFLHWEVENIAADKRDPWTNGRRMDGPFAYIFLPRAQLKPIPSIEEVNRVGAAAFREWGGIEVAKSCLTQTKQ